MECPDGRERKCFPLLALHACDHKEALKTTLTKKTTCTGCEAHEGQLDRTECGFVHKKASDMEALYHQLKEGVLDDEDNVLPAMGPEVLRREQGKFMGCR
jgi:hypothetical protein